jgi:hypothetical protein
MREVSRPSHRLLTAGGDRVLDSQRRHTVKSKLALVTALLTAAVVAAPAAAEERVCRGTIGSATVDNLKVPDRASCTLRGTRVRGTIKVGTGSTLVANRVRVIGNVQAERSRRVVVRRGSRVGGSIQIVKVRRGGAVRRSRIVGDVQFFENRGRIVIRGNRINGNLQCKENKPRPIGGRNRVGGNKEDQCRRL